MTTTVAALADRVLRRLGVVVVPAGDRPPSTATVTIPSIAAQALQRLGVIVPASERPGNAGATTVQSIAASALERLAVIVPASQRPGSGASVTVPSIAASALQRLGVVVPASDRPPGLTTVAVPALAASALQRLGVIVAEADRPSSAATVTATAIGAAALQRLGIVIPFADRTHVGTTTPLVYLATRALEMLAVVASDETPLPADQTLAEDTIRALNDSLVERGLVPWPSDAIPEAASEDLIQLGAIYLAPPFGKVADVTQRPVIEARIVRVALDIGAQALAEKKVAELTASMVAHGIIDWTVIPASAAEEYVQMVAAELAPIFGQEPPDPALRPAFEARVGRIALVAGAQDIAEEKINEINASLISHGIIDWTIIPASAAEEYIQMAAAELAPLFGQEPPDPAHRPAFEARIARISLVRRAQAMAEEKVSELNASLISRALVSWTAIPASAAEEYIQMTAGELAPAFGQEPPDPALRAAQEARIGRISLLTRAQSVAEAKVNELNASLISRALVDWTVIPSSAAEEYIQMTAAELAPLFGLDAPDPALRPAFEARVGRISLIRRAQPMAEAKVAQIAASMVSRGIVTWTEIPASAAEQYIEMTAIALAPVFGQEADPKLYAALEQRVRQISVIARAPQDAHDAVMSVHTDLAASDKVRWSVFDIPVAAEMPYVIKATNRIAPTFEVAADPRAEAQADATLARIIALPTSGEVTRAEYF